MIGPIRSVHRTVIQHLVPASAMLLLTFGALAYWIENRRVDEFVFDQATAAARHFNVPPTAALFAGNLESHRAEIERFLKETPFVGVRVYSGGRTMLIEAWHEPPADLIAAIQGHGHDFPDAGRYHRNKLWVGDRLYIQTMLPLTNGVGSYGYFEGIYQVAPQVVASGKGRVRDTLVVVMLVVVLSTLALYPVIVALNRDTLRLSARLLEGNVELMSVLGSAIAKRDSDTDKHNYRVALYAVRLAETLRRPADEIAVLIAGAFLHDVGKIGIPDGILLKPGRLTAEEFAVMQTHVAIGEEIVTESKWLQGAREVVANHHEKYDGSGYPRGLRNADIPFNARLFAIVDVFDALTSKRPYKEALGTAETLRLLRRGRGTHFDPDILDAFEQLVPLLLNDISTADKQALKGHLVAIIRKYFGVKLDAKPESA